MTFQRIHLIVLDSVGIGEAPDAADFGDQGANTLGHIAESMDLKLPNLQALGLGNIEDLKGIDRVDSHSSYWTKLEEESIGKDTMTGHWELMGLHIENPFKVFPNGFPDDLIQKIKAYTGRGILANAPYSGTKVIDDFGPTQMETGDLIIYTSADSVLQIAAHEDIVPLEELYDICEYIRSITREAPYQIGRIIARPYLGEPGNFHRTANRHDYALSPFGSTTLDILKDAGLTIYSIGKIEDIFNGQGITNAVRTISNMNGVDKLLEVMGLSFKGLSFSNLVDFDTKFGHRRDPLGYGQALEDFDQRLPEIMAATKDDDLLMITADHGNDPTFKGTDHTREYVPLLVYSPSFKVGGELAQGNYADVGQTIAHNFGLEGTDLGQSFLAELK